MKSIIYFIECCVSGWAITSCGEDRTYEYEERTVRDHWILDVMKEKYLWGDSIREEAIDWRRFFTDPPTFLSSVTAFAPIKDNWSWCSIDTINNDYYQRGYFNHLNSYGIDFIIMTDPTGATSKQYARVVFVASGSPADRCGIERGDFIGYVDGTKFSNSITDKLVSGGKRTLVVSKLGVDEEAAEYVWASTDTLYMERSEYVEDIAFPVCKTFKIGDNTVGYLMANRLTCGPDEIDEDSKSYISDLDNCMDKLKGESPNLMILDLRYCNYGNMDMANRLASYMLNSSFKSEVFANTIYNKRRTADNKTILFNSDVLDKGLSATDVFVITSNYTQGPAEWIIRALFFTLGEEHVFVVGSTTAGQIVMTEEIKSEVYATTLHPAVAYVANMHGEFGYAQGISADYEINENMYIKLYPFGDVNEPVLAFLLSQIEISY